MRRFILILVCVLMVTASLGAKHKGHRGKGKHEAYARFRVEDVREIERYYYGRPGGLPPGLEKKLARGGRLPPGWEKKMVPFPVEVERRLPLLDPGYCRGMIGGQAVIYNERTRVILDIAVPLGRH